MSPTQQTLLAASRCKPAEVLIWAIAFAVPLLLPAHTFLVNEIAIVALFAVSLDLVLGYAGIVSLGQAAFFGIGAYAAGLFALHVQPAPLTGLLAATAIAALIGLVCSVTVIRGSALSCLMVTLGVSLILLELANKFSETTGGADGLQGIVMGPVLGWFEFDLTGRTAVYYSLVVALLVFLVVRRIANSPFCATLIAIRDNRLRAMAVGIPVTRRLMLNYTIAAAVAGAAGALLAQTTAFVSLDVFDIVRSADVLLMLVIGGIGWLYGGIVGAVIFKLLHDLLSHFTPQYWTFWMGLFLVVLMRVGRDRLIRPWLWFRRQS